MLELGRKLRILLAEKNIQKRDFAEIINNVTPQTVSNWLHRDLQPTLENAKTICRYSKGYIKLEDCGY